MPTLGAKRFGKKRGPGCRCEINYTCKQCLVDGMLLAPAVHGNTTERMLPAYETVLYGVKEGDEDWQEVILSTKPEVFDKVKERAKRDGFGRFRVAKVDLTSPPDFGKVVR